MHTTIGQTMSLSYEHFENQVHAAFPTSPIIVEDWPNTCCLEFEAKRLIRGKPWCELIGWRLCAGELDISPSCWIDTLPVPTMIYYLPAHLILASIVLRFCETNYAHQVMEAFILPSSGTDIDSAMIEDELALDTSFVNYGSSRLRIYHAMSVAQRSCIAEFLRIYFSRHKDGFSPMGIEIFNRNIHLWKK
jgi:hypothetical protein